jgi:hypothetical protein
MNLNKEVAVKVMGWDYDPLGGIFGKEVAGHDGKIRV